MGTDADQERARDRHGVFHDIFLVHLDLEKSGIRREGGILGNRKVFGAKIAKVEDLTGDNQKRTKMVFRRRTSKNNLGNKGILEKGKITNEVKAVLSS